MGTDEKISAAVIDSTDRRLKTKISSLPQQDSNSPLGRPSRTRKGWSRKNRGPTSAPELVELIPSLKRELCQQRDRACVACKYGFRIIEVCIARRDERFVSRSHRAKAVDVIHSQPKARIAARNVLGMVDDVPKLRAEPELLGLREIQVLVDAEVNVVGS